jgi:hypothetical protein
MPAPRTLNDRVQEALAAATTIEERFAAIARLLRTEVRARGHEVRDDFGRAVLDRYLDSFAVTRTGAWRVMGPLALDVSEGLRQAVNAAVVELETAEQDLAGQDLTSVEAVQQKQRARPGSPYHYG